MITSGRTYFIINKKSGTAFDLNTQDQRCVIGYPLHKGDNQKWKITEHPDGWTLQNVQYGKFLDVDVPNQIKEGERVVAIDTRCPRKWDIRHDEQFCGYRIVIHGSNMDVDLSDNGNPAPGTPVTLWGQWAGENQVWKFEEAC